jgi:hypothetical protein
MSTIARSANGVSMILTITAAFLVAALLAMALVETWATLRRSFSWGRLGS